MAVTIHKNPHPSTKLRHYTINLHNTHTISTTVTSHPGIVRNWIYRTLNQYRQSRHRLIVGLGVQWTPTHNPAATIQLCIGSRCLIFHLHHSPTSPRILRRLLFDHRITFVGIWNHSDAKKLRESRHNLEMIGGMPVDLRHHVCDRDGNSLIRASVAEIAEEVIGIDIELGMETSRCDWEVFKLSKSQVMKAAVDAFVAFAVGMDVKAWDFNTFL